MGSSETELVDRENSKRVQKSNKAFDRDGLNPWRWLPPELYAGTRLYNFSDIWSYGVTAWEVFSGGKMPYKGVKNFQQYVTSNKRLPQPVDCPDSIFFLSK